MKRISILIADEHPQVRTLVLERLAREADLEIVGVASDSSAAVRKASETCPQVVLIDPMMDDGSGLDAIHRIGLENPQAVIVVLSAFTDTAQKIELEKLGVRFILNKGIESYKLVETLKRAALSTNAELYELQVGDPGPL